MAGIRVSVRVERVLCAAARDPELKSALLRQREAALDRGRFGLDPAEREMLCRIPPAQLCACIESIDLSAESVERRSFLRAVVATSAAVAAVSSLQACGDDAEQKTDATPPKGDGGPGDISIEPDRYWWDPTDGSRP